MKEIEPCGDLGSPSPRKAGSLHRDGTGNLYRSAEDSYYDAQMDYYFTPSRLVELAPGCVERSHAHQGRGCICEVQG
jgi:hypothetical protein